MKDLERGCFAMLWLALSSAAFAESTLVSSGSAATASARVNFAVVVPRTLFFALGTGSTGNLATNATIDTVAFDYSSNYAAVGTGAMAGSTVNTALNARIYCNTGQTTLRITVPSTLTSGSNTIPIGQLWATSSSTNLPTPTNTGVPVYPVRNTTLVTDRTATWTYGYLNTVSPNAGTYTAQVTYTASAP